MATGEGDATFNPQVQPEQAQNYAFWSRPSQRIQPDVSKETLFKGIGTGIKEGAEVADNYVKEGIIEPQVEQQAGAIRDSFTDSLETARTQMAQATLLPGTIKSDETAPAPIPGAVSNVGRNAQQLQGALDSGHISETYYYGQLNSLAKSMRAQYPGYRDYIDQQLARVTGVHPANQYVRSLIGDMNRIQEQQKSGRDKTQDLIRDGIKEGIPAAKMWADSYAAGKMTDLQIEHQYADAMAFKYQHARDQAAHESQKNNQEDDARFYTDQGTSVADRMVDSLVTLPITLAGHDPGSLLQIAQRQAGGESFGDADWVQADRVAQANLMTARAQLTHYLHADSGNGLSNSSRMGMKPSEEGEWITQRLAPIQTQIDAIGGKDLHMYAGNAATNKAMIDDQTHLKLLDPKNLSLATGLSMFKQFGGENALPLITDKLINNGKLDQLAGWLDSKTLDAANQPKASQGIFATLFGATTEAKAKNIFDPRAYDSLTSNIDLLNSKDTSIQTKLNTAHYFFDAANGNLMPLYKEDSVDSQGNVVKGKYALWDKLYNDSNSKSLWKLQHDSGDANVYQKYQASAEENAFRLFGDKFKDLDFISRERSGPQTDYTFKYADGKITAMDKNGVDVSTQSTGRFHRPSYVQDTVAKLNQVTQGLRAVYKPVGGDVDAFVLQSLDRLGINKENMTGLTGQLVNAILSSRTPKDAGTKGQDRVPAGR